MPARDEPEIPVATLTANWPAPQTLYRPPPALRAPSSIPTEPHLTTRFPTSFSMFALAARTSFAATQKPCFQCGEYEVWTYTLEPKALILVRSFEFDAAVVLAAYLPKPLREEALFFGALEQLAAFRRLPRPPASSPQYLRRLDPNVAAEALNAATAALIEGEGVVVGPGLVGRACPSTLEQVRALKLIDVDGLPASSFQGPLFFTLAHRVFAQAAALCPKHKREQSRYPAIEVLEHTQEHGMLVLIGTFSGVKPFAAAFLPKMDEAHHSRSVDAVLTLVSQLNASDRKLKLLSELLFQSLPLEQAVKRVDQELVRIEKGLGCLHEFLPRADILMTTSCHSPATAESS